MPGLPSCVDCGQDLGALVEEPTAYVPRVQAANPLREKRARPERKPPPIVASGLEHVGRVRHLPWQAFFEGVVGLVMGAIPGLQPARRREWRAAGLQLGLFWGAVVAAVLLGGGWAGLGSFSWLVAMGWSVSPASECKRRMNVPEPYRTSAALWLTLAPTVALALGLPWLVRGPPDPVFHYGMPGSLLSSGSYNIVSEDLEEIAVGELLLLERSDVEARLARVEELIALDDVARLASNPGAEPTRAEDRHRWALRTRDNLTDYEVFPVVVLALEDQLLDWKEGELWVDGAPSEAVPVHTWMRRPLASDHQATRVPVGQIAVWDWIPYPADSVLHVNFVPRELLMGRLWRRGRYTGELEPLPWPPSTQHAEEYP
jgi:hypothetical protein